MAPAPQLRHDSGTFDPLRRERTLARHPLLGSLMLGLPEPVRVDEGRKWSAEGKQLVAATLAKRSRPGVHVLQEVRLPGGEPIADHVVVSPSGVWVVDVHRYRGRVEVRKPLRSDPKLKIAGRDKTSLSHALAGHVDAVGAIVEEHLPGTAVRGVLCFVDAELPLLGNLTIAGQLLLTRKALARRIGGTGAVSPAEARALKAVLSSRLDVDREQPLAPGVRLVSAA